MTRNKTSIVVELGSTGQANPYETDPNRRITEQKDLSRGIYSATVDTNPFIVADDKGLVALPGNWGEPVAGPEEATQRDFVYKQANDAVKKLMGWQYFGDDWNAKIATEKVPVVMTGAIAFGGKQGNTGWSKQEWKDALYPVTVSHQNNSEMIAVNIFAEAYLASWSAYYQNDEMINRIAAALDFFTVAQGAIFRWRTR